MQIFLHLPPLTNVRHQKLTVGWRRWPSLCESTNPPPSREPTRLPYSSPSPPLSQPLWHSALLHRSCQASLHLRSLPYPHASRLSTLRRRRPSQCPMESRLCNQPFRWLALHLRRWWPTCSVLPRIISPSRYLCKCPRCTSSLHLSPHHQQASLTPRRCVAPSANPSYLQWQTPQHFSLRKSMPHLMGLTAGRQCRHLCSLWHRSNRSMPSRPSGPHWRAARSNAPLHHPQTPSPPSSTRHLRSNSKDTLCTQSDSEGQCDGHLWRNDYRGNHFSPQTTSAPYLHLSISLSARPCLVFACEQNRWRQGG